MEEVFGCKEDLDDVFDILEELDQEVFALSDRGREYLDTVFDDNRGTLAGSSSEGKDRWSRIRRRLPVCSLIVSRS